MTFNEFIQKLEEDVYSEAILNPLGALQNPARNLRRFAGPLARTVNKVAGAVIPAYRPISMGVSAAQKLLADYLKKKKAQQKMQNQTAQNAQQAGQNQKPTPLGKKMAFSPNMIRQLANLAMKR